MIMYIQISNKLEVNYQIYRLLEDIKFPWSLNSKLISKNQLHFSVSKHKLLRYFTVNALKAALKESESNILYDTE